MSTTKVACKWKT